MAPIDIIIDICKRHKCETENQKGEDVGISYYQGKIDAYDDLIQELEGFKKLFN